MWVEALEGIGDGRRGYYSVEKTIVEVGSYILWHAIPLFAG